MFAYDEDSHSPGTAISQPFSVASNAFKSTRQLVGKLVPGADALGISKGDDQDGKAKKRKRKKLKDMLRPKKSQ